MKKIVLPLLLLLFSFKGIQAQIAVTYKVDITDYLAAGNSVGANGIRIGGNFAAQGASSAVGAMPDWTPSNPACAMTDMGNNIWAITVTYATPGASQLYKFVNNDWGSNEGTDPANTLVSGGCALDDGGGNVNRVLVIPSADTTLCYKWDGCSGCSSTPPATTVSTDSVISNLFYNSATVKGKVSGLNIELRGFCYSTNANPEIGVDSTVLVGQGSGMFEQNLTGLLPSTTYYVRAFAVNSSDVIFPGNIVQFTTYAVADFPVISTTAATGITETEAVSGGNISSAGNSPITARGVCWSTSPNPTVNLSTKTVDGSGSGVFTSNITNLGPGLTFHVRAYATNAIATVYGEDVTFTTSGTQLQNIQVTLKVDVSAYLQNTPMGPNKMRVGGNFADFGAKRGDSLMVNWSPANEHSRMDSLGNNIWAITITYPSSSSGSTQLYKFVNNNWGTNEGTDAECTIGSYGCGTADNDRNRILQVPFTNKEYCFVWDACTPCGTTVSAPAAVTDTAINVSDVSATIECSSNGAAIGRRGVVYSLNPNPTNLDSVRYASANGEGNFSVNLSGLNAETMYYVRSFAKNPAGFTYGNQISFTTSAATSVNAKQQTGALRVVPNPGTGIFRFDGLKKSGELVIRTIHGKEVWRGMVSPGENVNLTGLLPASYFYSIRTTDSVASGQLLRQ
jgi:hypothetical protein